MGTIGENIKRIRIIRNLTQWELAELISKSQKTISSWECGFRYPQSKDVKRLAEILKVAPAEIIGHTEENDTEFEFIATTDDMSPDIQIGDTLTVDSTLQPNDGDLVVVQDKKKHEFVRRIYKVGRFLSLMALNPQIKPITTDVDSITIRGKVTELRRKV